MENEKLFELMEKFYGEFSTFRKETKEEFKELKNTVTELQSTVTKIEVKLEQDMEPKIEALFDGYKQNSNKLDRIEKEVSKQEEVIIRRIK